MLLAATYFMKTDKRIHFVRNLNNIFQCHRSVKCCKFLFAIFQQNYFEFTGKMFPVYVITENSLNIIKYDRIPLKPTELDFIQASPTSYHWHTIK